MKSNGSARLLFVSYTATTTGPTNSLCLLIKHLRREHEVAVALPRSGVFSEKLEGMGISTMRFSSLGKGAIPALARLLRVEGFDLVYANTTDGSSRNAFIAAKLARIPYICHVRALGWQASWHRLWHLRFANAVIAVSEACAASVGRFVAPGRLHVIHNGVPISIGKSKHGASRVRSQFGVPPDAFLVLSVSHLSPRKGQAYAIEAMREVLNRLPHAHLCLIGEERDPEYVADLRSQVEEMGLAARVHFVGFRDDVRSALADADALLHTALADPHPRAILEAMAEGLPVIAFSVDGVPETVTHGETGILVPSRDTSALAEGILKVGSDARLAQRLGACGKGLAARCFSDERTAQQVGLVIERVLQESREKEDSAS